MELKVKFETGVEVVECPTSWYSLSTAAYQKLILDWKSGVTPQGMIEVFASLTGRSISDYESSEDVKLEMHILNATKFVYEDDLDKLSVPVTFLGKELDNKLGKMTLAQNLHVRNHLDGKDVRTCLSYVIAIYMQPTLDNAPFNLDRAKEIEKLILTLPIAQTYKVGFFFLKRLKRYGNSPTNYWLQMKLTIKNSMTRLRQSIKLQTLSRLRVMLTWIW